MDKGKTEHAAQRSTLDSRAFMQEEKFDTWLDLGPLYEIQKYCRMTHIWSTSTFSPLNCIFSGDTICLIKKCDVLPSTVESAVVTPCLPAMLVNYALTNRTHQCHMTPKAMKDLYSVASKSTQISLGFQLQHILRNVSPSLLTHHAKSCDVWTSKLNTFPIEIVSTAYIVEDMMLILEAYKFLSEYRPEKTTTQRSRSRILRFQKRYGNDRLTLALPSFNAKIMLSLDLCILDWQSKKFLLTHKYLLEIINKVSELFCCLLYTHMISGTSFNINHYTQIVKFLHHISQTVSTFCRYSNIQTDLEYENRAFMYLKVMEGLGVACIILREDQQHGWFNDDLINQLWKSVIEERLQPSTAFFDSTLFKILDSSDVSTIAESLGLVKLCGHPSVEIFRGLQKLKERTHANIVVNPTAVNRTIGVMKRELILNFKRKRGRYPNIRLDNHRVARSLQRLIIRNISPDSDEGINLIANITIEHWSHVDLEKNDEFDPIDNQLVLLKDKALGMTRSKVMKYILCDESKINKAGLGPIEERRALLAFLLSDHFSESFRRYIYSYENDEVWSHIVLDYLVIKLTAKELEEKPEGRMFGASPGEERNRRIVQEENSMRLMDNFFRDQLMTPDELQMLRKLYSFRHFNRMYPHHKLLQVSFDFSKWNNNMRAESIDIPASETLDKWFGTKIYGKTMKAYESTLFYYKDMLRSDYWDGQLGGIEGLNQATWSVIFLCGIKQALEGLGLIYQLTVKGDDVRAALVIPETELDATGVVRIRDTILHQLSELCKDMGWQLNPHECFVSLSVIATSKQYQVNDTFLPAATKKIIKMESLSNLIFPTTEDMVASVFSTAHSACSQATTILPAFISALYVASRLLYRELCTMGRISVEDIAVLSMWPQCLGGPGSLPLQSFFVRGENDMLSISVSLFRSIILSEENGISMQIINILRQRLKNDSDKTLLLSDPYSISLDHPERPSAVLKRMMRSYMPKWVKNPDLIILLNLDTERTKKEFLEHICSMRPFFGKIATTLYETSPFYIIDEVLSKFMESSTIFSFFSRGKTGTTNSKNAHRALTKVLMAAKRRKLYWVSILRQQHQYDQLYLGIDEVSFLDRSTCTTEIIHKIRFASWGIKIHGITYPSIVDQNVYYTTDDLLYVHPTWDVGHCATPILVEMGRSVYQTSDKSFHYSASPGLAPWLGAQTSSKLELPKTTTRISSPAISKIMRLINLRVNAHILGPQFTRTVNELISSLTGINLESLNVLVPEAGGGHISHRVAINSFSVNTMPNCRPNLAQLVRIASDAGASLRGDNTNRTINFAARHYFSIIMALWPLQSSSNLPDKYPTMLYTVFHNNVAAEPQYAICEWCCNDVDDRPIRFDQTNMPPLRDYRMLSLVGCSEFEEKTLKINMAEALIGKIRRTAFHEIQNINDPALIDIAAHVVIRKLNTHKIKIFEAAKGASFMCVPRAELLQIMSVALGITSLTQVSKNIIRLLPSENLYKAVMAEVFNFCLEWLSVTSDPENLYHVDKLMNHLNPLTGLFDELLESQVLHQLQQGARDFGDIKDFRWTPASQISGGAAMKCFFSYHKDMLRKWLFGEIIVVRPKLYTQMEDNDTIKASLEKEYQRLLGASLNRSNTMFNGFRISSHWKRIFFQLDNNNHFQNNVENRIGYSNYSTADDFHISVPQLIFDHYLDDILTNIGIITMDDVEQFWAHTLMCLMITSLTERGPWQDMSDEMINNESEIQIMTIEEIHEEAILFYSVERLKENELYIKWSSVLSVNHLACLINIGMMRFQVITEKCLDYLIILHNQLKNWLQIVNIRHLSVMTQDNAEIILKGMDKVAEQVVHERKQQIDDDKMNQYAYRLGISSQKCGLSNLNVHRQLMQLSKPVQIKSTYENEFPITGNITGLKYDTIPPIERYFFDATEILRGSGVHNTSIAKYLEITDKIANQEMISDISDDSCILCLADGIGGVSARFLANYPEIHVVYNSMYYNVKTGKHAADANEAIPPIEVSGLPHHYKALERLHWRGMFPGDITSTDVQNLVASVTKKTNRLVLITTMDADIPWHDNLMTAREVWFGALRIVALVQNYETINIFKCFAIHHAVVYEFCHTIYALYSHVHMVRASYTRQRSTEFFLVFSHPRNFNSHLQELENEMKNKIIFARSLTIASIVRNSLNKIGKCYMNFRQLGENNQLDILVCIKNFLRLQAYPLDLNNTLNILKVVTPLRQTCLCGMLRLITDLINDSLNSARYILDDLLYQAEQVRYRDVGVYIRNSSAVSTGWKGIQMQLRVVGRLMAAHEWMQDVMRYPDRPITTWNRVSVDRIYQRMYLLLNSWKGHVAPIIVKNNLIVCCERFNDNWTVMISHTIRKCVQLMGSYWLCHGYVHRESPFIGEAMSFLSRFVRIEPCCKSCSDRIFSDDHNWVLPQFSISLDAPPSRVIPAYDDIPNIAFMLSNNLLLRGERKYEHKNVEVVDPNLVHQVDIIVDQPDDDLRDIVNEHKN
ncbi:TPA_asm: RNA-dependent RNA polymerase [Nomada lathburiana mononega-like virus]|uniref:RNA-directed RNA polymerase n=2 Tax=Jingchuvirales TaxID=2499407 RepID=A0AAV2YAJ3_9VIRU|nr:RNA-dependent RNA polymerase [Nomada lathburiana mononega-like virus]DAZ89736.1 TPA_asm: RNA-dependent RNA polymerase [Nomada lathburiana mononega-like virus]